MTVAELIAELANLPQNLPVCTEDEAGFMHSVLEVEVLKARFVHSYSSGAKICLYPKTVRLS